MLMVSHLMLFLENKNNKRKQDWWLNTAGADLVPLNNDDMKRQLSPQSHKGRRFWRLWEATGSGGRGDRSSQYRTACSGHCSHTLDCVEHCGNVHKAEHLSLKYHKGWKSQSPWTCKLPANVHISSKINLTSGKYFPGGILNIKNKRTVQKSNCMHICTAATSQKYWKGSSCGPGTMSSSI